jgi:hypothetical protein
MGLSERDLWVRDITNLRRLGSDQMQNVAINVSARLREAQTYMLNNAAFGELYQLEHQISSAYESVRSVLCEKLQELHQGLQGTATGLVKIADHYAELERRMSH